MLRVYAKRTRSVRRPVLTQERKDEGESSAHDMKQPPSEKGEGCVSSTV